jgi:hypothetical protein
MAWFGWKTEVWLAEDLRWLSEEGVEACLAKNSEKILSAAASVGSSRFAAGVPVRDLERRVDFPKEPVSGMARRARIAPGLPSALLKASEDI